MVLVTDPSLFDSGQKIRSSDILQTLVTDCAIKGEGGGPLGSDHGK